MQSNCRYSGAGKNLTTIQGGGLFGFTDNETGVVVEDLTASVTVFLEAFFTPDLTTEATVRRCRLNQVGPMVSSGNATWTVSDCEITADYALGSSGGNITSKVFNTTIEGFRVLLSTNGANQDIELFNCAGIRNKCSVQCFTGFRLPAQGA